ncbi:MAG: DUF89 family protein [Phycisphaeraceae bacterium]|nr:DUF89 family protein [Phycisphaeraceae bacterium]
MFPLIAEPDRYIACELPFGSDAEALAHWLAVFSAQFQNVAIHAAEVAGGDDEALRKADSARIKLQAFLDRLARQPALARDLTLLDIDAVRDQAFREAGIHDPHLLVKKRENEAALPLLPDLLQAVDQLDMPQRLEFLAGGIFAGNMFDLGVTDTIEMFKRGEFSFESARKHIPPRPWHVDDLDDFIRDWLERGWKKAVVFVDNAGTDIVLGMMPATRELLRAGTDVVLTANSEPSLNDITHAELLELLGEVRFMDPIIADALRTGQLKPVPSGNALPLIDLSKIDGELTRHAADADLLILEGMGRAVETNYNTRFTCDTVKVAMLKEPRVAAFAGGRLFDAVFRYEPADH